VTIPSTTRPADALLLDAGRIEHEITRLIADVKARHEASPSRDSARALEALEGEHARVLELLLDLQRERLPPRL
jgi:hypothetical protein